jgi:hypothetical protein
MKNRHGERGQALIVIVFAIIGLVGITALAVDGGNAFVQTRRAQTAADSAALGGALARIKGEDWVATTYAIAAQHGFEHNGTSTGVAVNSPPANGPYQGDVEYIQVIIGARTRAYFAGVVGVPEIRTTVQAVARTKSSEIKEILDGSAVISLARTSDCASKKAFWVHSEATLSVRGGNVFINSDNEECALIEQGSGGIRIIGGEVVIVGGARIQKPQLITPFPPQTGAVSISYPPPFFMPNVGCSEEAEISMDGKSMSPGDWEEDFPPSGVLSLEPGKYCLQGDFIIGDGKSLEGKNVVFSVDAGRVRWSGHATINLDAPRTGPLAGLLLYVPPDNHSYLALNMDAQSGVKGTILAPGAQIRLNGSRSSTGFHSQIIAYRIEVDGTSNIEVAYLDEQNWDAITMPEIELAQ